jgi:hypothetical protein
LAAWIKLGAVLIFIFSSMIKEAQIAALNPAISHGFSTISRNVSQLHADAATAEIIN